MTEQIYTQQYPEFSDVHCVRAKDFYANNGMVVLQVIEADEVVQQSRQEYYGNDNYTCRTVYDSFAIKSPLLLVGKPKGAVESELRERIVEQQRELNAGAAAFKDQKKIVDAFQDQIDKLGAAVERELKKGQDLYADLKTTRDLKRKLEEDIGKIRAAIGELQIKKILEPTNEQPNS